jgi:hypothetical protein
VDNTILDGLLRKAHELLGAKFRLKDIEVEEVSIVDRAANRRKFLVVKRGSAMSDEIKKVEEQAPTVLQALSDGLGKLVGIVERVKQAMETTPEVEKSLDSSLASELHLVGTSLLKVAEIPVDTSKAEGVLTQTLRSVAETAMSIAQSVAESAQLKPSDLEGVKALAAKLMSVCESYPSPVTQGEDAELEKAEGILSRTLRQVSEQAMSLAQSVGESTELKSDDLDAVKAISDKLKSVIDKYPSPVAHSETVVEEKSEPEMPVEEPTLPEPVALSSVGTEAADKLAVLGQTMMAIANAEDPDSLAQLRDRIIGVAKSLSSVTEGTLLETIGSAEQALKIEKAKEPAPEVVTKSDSEVGTSTALENRIAELEGKLAQLLTTPQAPASRQEQVPEAPKQKGTPRRSGGIWAI